MVGKSKANGGENKDEKYNINKAKGKAKLKRN